MPRLAVLVLTLTLVPLTRAEDAPVGNPALPGLLSVPDLVRGYKMPHSGLSPAVPFPNLCLYRYRVSTQSPKCQEYVDQALGFYYSYVWMEAARSFETALRYDPECAFAWLGLSKALDKWEKRDAVPALRQAMARMDKANDRERLLIRARSEQKGLAPGVGPDERDKKAAATLDELLAIVPDDQEAWFARGQLAKGNAGAPYYLALLRLNPVHPGAAHELVHFYENIKRPALGWPHAQAYMASSPSVPHAFHMQAHLATRLGKWHRTTDWSARAVELEKAYHRRQAVKPADDHQYSHHLEILTLSLTHDGRFAEARGILADAKAAGVELHPAWFALFRRERAWNDAWDIVKAHRKKDKAEAAYFAATLYLDLNQPGDAKREIDALRDARQTKKRDKKLDLRIQETTGRYLCRTGSADEGLKLLARTVEKTKDDFEHHSWGNGAYFMETWGEEALNAGRPDVAEEAFAEALAHDAGSARAALGMQMLCERQGRPAEAAAYAAVVARAWARADAPRRESLRDEMLTRSAALLPAEPLRTPSAATCGGE